MDTALVKAGQQSYGQWVRWAIGMARGRQRQAVTFFDSSVPEPTELLRETVAGAFGGKLTPFYTSAFGGGNPFVLDMLAERYGVPRDQVLGTTGATGGLSILYRALARPGDHVLVESPGFDLFRDLAESHGLEVGTFDRTTERFTLDLDQIEGLIQPRTRMIVLSNLHNPSGMALDYDVLRALAAIAERRGVYVIVDEVYGDYADAAVRPCAAAALSPNLVSISSLTKIFGLGSLRCGWIVGSSQVLGLARDVSGKLEFGISTLSHAVGAHVLHDPAPFVAYSNGIIERARPLMAAWLDEQKRAGLVGGVLPEAGCIMFPRLLQIDDSEAFCTWLLERSGVIVAPGDYFGAPGHVRIGFAQHLDNLRIGLDALAEGLRSYPAAITAAATPPKSATASV